MMQVLPELGFFQPTQIQQQTIPVLSANQVDLISLAQTGTGKTAAFGLPLLDKVDISDPVTQAVILAPTRELCQQIAQQMEAFARYVSGVRMQAVYGGTAIQNQIKALKRPTHLIIATPGRLIDLIKRKVVHLEHVRFVVLDEADEMLNMGFKEELDKILAATPKEKNTWLFSATMPREIRDIAKNYMHEPVEISVIKEKGINADIEHQFAVVKATEKTAVLMRILDNNKEIRGLVFCRTKSDTQDLANTLQQQGYPVEALHGDLSQNLRDKVIRKFKSFNLQLVIATDVAARGIDVDDLSHVIHFAMPDSLEYYTHRSGRTARAGKQGISLILSTKADKKRIAVLEKKLKINFTEIPVPSWASIRNEKLINWVQEIRDTQPEPAQLKDFLPQVEKIFNGMEKEELISKLVMNQLNQLKQAEPAIPAVASRASSEPKGKTKRERNKKETRKSSDKGKKTKKFFINVGHMDQVSDHDLQSFICQKTKLSKEQVNNITILEKYSYFEVSPRHVVKVNESFKNIFMEGRKLRVNPA